MCEVFGSIASITEGGKQKKLKKEVFLLQENTKWQKMLERPGGPGLRGLNSFGIQNSAAGLGALGHGPGHFTSKSLKTS